MALYPRQNSNSHFQHCCFELLLVFTFQYPTSTVQHCLFTIQCAYFKRNVIRACDILIPCSMCLSSVKCNMLPTQSNILVSCIPKQYPYFAYFASIFCNIHVFQYNFDNRLCRVRYACYTIQYSSLDIELHTRVT